MLHVNHISFQYNQHKKVLENINFTLKAGEHLCVMGESGCGKSTLLKTIYGLVDVNEGDLFWKDTQILGPAHHLVPGMGFFKYVPQNFDLMPYTSVSENISKFLSRFYPEEAKLRTEELLEVIEMTEFANEKVKTLSGGQQQRVAIARALAKEPELLLLDEPFSQIDNFKKNSLRRKLFSYLKEKNIACIVATHDGNDALSFADKMIVIKDNQIIADAHPKELYKNPKMKYVASLFDDVNELIVDEKSRLLYPHQLKFVEKSNFKATVTNSYFKGFYWLIEVDYNSKKLFISNHEQIEPKTEIFFDFI
ncbi:ABC transporter ATP-binding protein [Tenacibaculum sp. IB213877]|uniref:ABC transporter ATP-binding protein n=1 Tax=Tenacibaculum sp. IB213877 TaxID=3097351 RepID=UPI002A5A8E23|nr:ABC transporter ATP-binding protein [Tenacibaculum sp. IB213877]MDY0780438.1 ABC transporter ATP-binding protein [Tenacibaculum sp. IB213877]